jgi:predicted RNA binding protein YcfA (HicA-like mRNA interferase family)
MKAREFIRRLKKNGVEVIEGRGKGGHVLARYQGKQATIPVHGSKDVDPVFLQEICKQLGIDHTIIL